jgi:hypothetical protein
MRTAGQPHVAPPAPPVDPIDAILEDEDDEDDDKGDGPRALATVQPGAAPVQRIATQYATAVAVQQPRNLRRVVRKVEEEAGLVGEDFFYAWTQGRKLVEGVSVEGAMILARNWGNAAIEPELLQDAPSHWTFRATFVDLERGFTSGRLYRQRKGESHQKKQSDDADRLIDIAFQIGQSKAIRNSIVRALPEWLIRRGLETARRAAEEHYARDLPGMVTKAIEAFKSIGVSLAELEAKLVDEDGQPKPEASWTVADVRVLGGLYRAIQSRVTNVEKEFRKPAAAPAPAAPAPAAEAPKEKKP